MADAVSTATPLWEAGDVIEAAYNLQSSRVATCSMSGLVSVYEIHKGGTWMLEHSWRPDGVSTACKVAWAHPEFGALLAVGTDRGTVHVWERRRIDPAGPQWQQQAAVQIGNSAVTSLAFAPPKQGLRLAAASQDGFVRILESSDVVLAESWHLENNFRACTDGACLSICWRPHEALLPPLLLAGTSTGAQVWAFSARFGRWDAVHTLHDTGPVASVAWADAAGRPADPIALATGANVYVYNLSGATDALQVEQVARLDHEAPVWQVAWNVLGSTLLVSTDDSCVSLWRPDLTGQWRLVHRIVGSPDAARPEGSAGGSMEE